MNSFSEFIEQMREYSEQQSPYGRLVPPELAQMILSDDPDSVTEGMRLFNELPIIAHFKLIIFDIDGTIAAMDSIELLPGVFEWFKLNEGQAFAFATNQGGVGLRYWMERDSFGNPAGYPTREQVIERLSVITAQIPGHGNMYCCFAYQSKTSGKWAPTPEDIRPNMLWWRQDWRKPQPGMLRQAMVDAGCLPHETLMVGDSADDAEAAEAVGCHFMLAYKFFNRESEDIEQS